MSFSCDHCGLQNNEVQPAGTIQPKGTYYELRPTTLEDLNRQVIKADTASVKFIELDLEVPPGRGQLTNVEGLLSNIMEDLELGQEARKEQAPDAFAKIAQVIAKGRSMLAGESFPFRLFVDDPAGNSFITPDLKDGVGKWEKHEYTRTPEQNAELGLASTSGGFPEESTSTTENHQPGLTADGEIIPNEVYTFPSTCPGCSHPCPTNMKMVDIPHFKQVVLMSVSCESCGYRSNDVKTGGEIPERGERITLAVRAGVADLSRDILKSESCALECPELQLSVNAGTLGGRFTTIEGLLSQVRDDLQMQVSTGADSEVNDERKKWDDFFGRLEKAISGEMEFTMILSDPLASSFVQPLTDPPAPDPQITREWYDRTDEEEEDLGLKDMKTEGYEEDAEKEKAEKEKAEKEEAEKEEGKIEEES
jgi:zinc finger protein